MQRCHLPCEADTESFVLTALADSLDSDCILPDDNFLEKGGTSLMAARALVLIREEFGVEISLLQFFEDPTGRGLTALLEASLIQPPATGFASDDGGDFEEGVI